MAITLYSGVHCPYSHRCRIVLREKEMAAEIVEVDLNNKLPELSRYNPYNRVPTLVDREVRLYESNIINEYLDNRFPHPQLMPMDIEARAKTRMLMHVIDRELFRHLRTLIKGGRKTSIDSARKAIAENLVRDVTSAISKDRAYIVDKEFTMLDAALAPLLWRLQYYAIKLPRSAMPLLKYAERVFSRPSFIGSLTVVERNMRK